MKRRATNEDSYESSGEVFTTLLRGFDVEMQFNESSIASVRVIEAGADVFETTVDTMELFPGDEDPASSEVIKEVATAAIDQFEAQRGTLGEGAMALEAKMKKRAWFEAIAWEEWYMSFKGTVFEDQAAVLLDKYLSTYDPSLQANSSVEWEDVIREQDAVQYRMNRLYFDAMKSDTGRQTVIVINAHNKNAHVDVDELETWLKRFEQTKWEAQAIALAQEFVSISAKISELQKAEPEDNWEERRELSAAMAELKLTLLQQNLEYHTPDSGPELAPSMLNDLYELADGVSFDTELEPMSEGVIVASVTEREDYEPQEVIEKGQMHEGIDVAEIPDSQQPFRLSEKIKLSKEFEQTLWGGIKKTFPKGTQGIIDDLNDQHGNEYYVQFTDKDFAGKLLKIPVDYLTKA